MEIQPTPQGIAKTAFQSTVALEKELPNGGRVPLGSGFFVAQDLIATNLHVVHGVFKCYAKLVNQTNEFLIQGYTAIDVEHDLVILKVVGINTWRLPWGNSDNAQVGDTVYAVGNPQGLKGTFSDGIISGIRPDGPDGKLLQFTSPISSGSSGGPVLNDKGAVIGVSVSFFSNGQNLNFAIPSNYLKDLLAKLKNLQPLFQTKFEGVTWIVKPLTWNGSATYTFSLQNKHRWGVKNIHCLVLFYDELKRQIGWDILKYTEIIAARTTKDITRPSIFDIPYLKDLDFSNYSVADKIAFVVSGVISSGQDLRDYNIVDPVARRPGGSYEVRVIDYKALT